ncbi:hypothetical protein AB0P36_34890 [Streptomyces flavidovirens]
MGGATESSGERRVLVLDPDRGALVGIVSDSDINRALTWLAATRTPR